MGDPPLRYRRGKLPSGPSVDTIAVDPKTGQPTVVLDWATGEVHACSKAFNAEDALLITARLTSRLDQILAQFSEEEQIRRARKRGFGS